MKTILNQAFNVAVLQIADRLFPTGFDVSANAPDSLESLTRHYQETGRLLVWNGASDKTIFGDPEVNYAFRAWHDSKHIFGQFAFNLEGETQAFFAQAKDIYALFGGGTIANGFVDILRAEIIGEFEYTEVRGGFPIDQIGFARDYLCTPEQALKGDYGVSIPGIG